MKRTILPILRYNTMEITRKPLQTIRKLLMVMPSLSKKSTPYIVLGINNDDKKENEVFSQIKMREWIMVKNG